MGKILTVSTVLRSPKTILIDAFKSELTFIVAKK